MTIDHGALAASSADASLARSPQWPGVERAHLALEPACRCCKPGASKGLGLQVHHQFPFHFCILLGRADLELDQRNLITLCETEEGKTGPNHHLLVGHLDDFQSSNLDVYADATQTFFGWTIEQLRASLLWQAKLKTRLKPWAEMTPADKTTLRAEMDKRFPLEKR